MIKIDIDELENIQYDSVAFVSNAKAQNTAEPTQNYQHYVFSQNATAYVAASGAKGSSGTTMAVGMVAVHPKVFSSNIATAVNSGPIIPYGTLLTWQSSASSVIINGTQYRQFTVQDIGQTNNQQGYSTWWVDIYFGTNTPANIAATNQFGNSNTYSYTYWAPIDI